MPKRKNVIANENLSKYLKPPDWKQIEEFIIELETNMYKFEKFYGIPFNTLTQVKAGTKRLPPKFWHFIYEKIKPNYGVGFISDYTNENNKRQKGLFNKRQKGILIESLTTDSHNRLDEIK